MLPRDGLIYFPDFCHFVLVKLREDQPLKEMAFHQEMFKIFCGTEPLPTNRCPHSQQLLHSLHGSLYRRAKKYKLSNNAISKQEFFMVMRSLPEHVDDAEIAEMFDFADKNGDGQLSYEEFEVRSWKTILWKILISGTLDHG